MPDDDFSARLDRLWNYNDPAASAERFTALRRDYAPASREALEIDTQLARTESLRRQFAAAHARLDAVEPKLGTVDPRVTVRYRLERGRTYNSAGDRERARPLFAAAYELATASGRDGDEFYAIDALHMLAIVAPGDEAMAWNRKALAAATQARDPRARGWRASLLNNIGWTYFDAGDYAAAVGAWEPALALRVEAGDPTRVREARWVLARGWRAEGRLDDAERAQLQLVAETEAAHAPDGYVYEELMEIAAARGHTAAATNWATRLPVAARRPGPRRRTRACGADGRARGWEAMNPAKRLAIFERLRAADPHPRSELVYKTPYELLVAVVLSAQATDKSVNLATKRLFPVARTPRAMVKLGVAKLEPYISSIGLWRMKAKNVVALSQQLLDLHGGKVPQTREELQALPGVGRKTANVVLNVAFGQPTIAVDTHIFRVSNRTGLAPGKDVEAVEAKLEKVVPDEFKLNAHHWLILHGRYVCTARSPKCGTCLIVDLCEYKHKNLPRD